MSLIHSILLGIIQGITEFLPVSSSGHLAIAEHLLGVKGASDIPVFFDVLLHLGTLAAVFAAYWKELCDIVLEFFRGVGDLARGTTPKRVPPARRMVLLIILGTLPLFLVLPVKDKVEALSGNMIFIGCALLFTGMMLWLCDRMGKGSKNEKNARLSDSLIVGAAQALATCPGISRSGMTITAGCFTGFSRSFAVRYSFLLSIPAILGANILALRDAIKAGIIWKDVPVYLVGVLVAAATGYGCISLLRYIAGKGRFGVFAYYCWAVGILVLIFTIV
ncbi:MAG: undecaprenyl-diphosphate phosphatase [Oscillospiraceae bacterium]|nr:undecaprenyl-diphosphate phosphatase [Oscillospiraceae bacterium]